MKKKFLSIFLALCMCLSLLPTAALAADEPTGTPAATPTGTPLTADMHTLSSGTYYLSGNLTITQTIKVTGTVTLDLNGYVLKLNSSIYDGTASGSVIEVNTTGNLTLEDSNADAKHYFYAEEGSDLWRWDAAAEGETTQPADGNGKTYHTVTGGVITGGSRGNGGGILVAGGGNSNIKAVLTMEGGSIIGCTSNYGGGVYVGDENAEFTMKSGAVIAGCAASVEGGGVAVRGSTTFTMEGGKIHDCVCPRLQNLNDANVNVNAGRGGGVSVKEAGTFTMKGGSIENCRVYTKTQSLTGTAEGGGGVYSAGNFTMTGGKIVGCATEAGSLGDGILLSEGKTLQNVVTTTGDALKTDSGWADMTSRYCGNVTYALCTHDSANGSSCTVCGKAVVARQITAGGKTSYITSDGFIFAFLTLNAGRIQLLNDVSLPDSNLVTAPSDLTLELNGHTMTALGIGVSAGSLTIQDSSANKTGALDLNGIEVRSGGTLKLGSGKVTVSDPPSDTPEGYADGKITVKGAMTVTGGSITGNTGNDIYVENGGELTVTGGTVESSIHVNTGANLTITGGNIASLTVSGGSVQLSGGVFIKLVNEIADGKLVDLLRGGYAYYNCTVDQETGAVTQGTLINAGNRPSITGSENAPFTVATHTCSFTTSGDHQDCTCGRSITGTQPPVQYLDAHGAVQYCADYKVLDEEYVTSHTVIDGLGSPVYFAFNEGDNNDYWFVVPNNLTIAAKIIIPQRNTPHIILCDGVTLTGEKTLEGSDDGNSLTIYAQSTGANMGKLVLKGGQGDGSNGVYGMHLTENLTINGGDITVTPPSVSTGTRAVYGICANGNLTVNGGKIKVNAGTNTSVTQSNLEAFGIYCYGKLTVNGGEIDVTGSNATVTGSGSYGSSWGIIAYAAEINGGKVTAAGGNVTVNVEQLNHGGGSYGIDIKALRDSSNCYRPVPGTGELVVTAGTVTATGGMVNMTGGQYDTESGGEPNYYFLNMESCGICTDVSLTLNGGTIRANAKNVSATRTDGGSNSNDVAVSRGIRTNNAVLDGGNLYLTHGTASFTGSTLSHAKVFDMCVLSLTLSGSAVKLKESSLGSSVTAPDSAKLKNLLADGYAYWQDGEEADSFVKLADLTATLNASDTSYYVKTCTHSATSGTCAYCGKDLGAAPDPTPEPTPTPSAPTYTVSAPTTENGSVSVSPKNAKKGTSVTIAVTPDAGFTLETLTILDKDGNEIELTDNGDGTYSFKMPAGGASITAVFAPERTIADFFGDVPEDAYYHDAVLWAASRGITIGTSGSTFGPGDSCGRGQLVTFLWRAAGCPAASGASGFTDTDEDSYYGEAIRWAASLGIVGGYGNGAFGPDDTITREQMAVILYRFAQAMGMDTAQGGMAVREFEDYESVSGYAAEAMTWAVSAGIIQGYNNHLMPTQPCTRAQIVTMLYRLLG